MINHAWRSRGYLPHCDERGLVQHVIFGLADALPRSVPSTLQQPTERAAWADGHFDKGHGSRLLADSENAHIVEASLLHNDAERYALAAWCVMPTHVHVVLEPFTGFSLTQILHSWKSFTAHEINRRVARSGALWRREYFDRFMRSPEQFEWTVRYVEENPVAAGLTPAASDWRFSSANWKDRA